MAQERGPDFRRKADRVCRLYLRPPKGAVVVCVDEKPLQVLSRKYPSRADPRDGSTRFEYEYVRHGTQALLAAYDVQTARVFGRVVPHRGAEALVAFMNALARRYKRFRFVYTPKHASWMNQVEIWVSILQRRILKYGDFATPAAQAQRVDGFIAHWNQWERRPFRWTWRTDRLQNRRRAAIAAMTRCRAAYR